MRGSSTDDATIQENVSRLRLHQETGPISTATARAAETLGTKYAVGSNGNINMNVSVLCRCY